MRFLYNILFPIFFVVSAPFYFLKMWRRGNWQTGFAQRFGNYDETLRPTSGKPLIWFHAVSVGEVGICAPLLRELSPKLPGYEFVVSTTTSTGMGELKRLMPPEVRKIYYPTDFFFSVRKALNFFHPSAFVLVEAELWPNFLWQTSDRHIPMFLINARLSDRSLRGYKRAEFIFRPIFSKFRAVGCQSEADAVRLKELGFPLVKSVGNLKFDAAKPGRSKIDAAKLLEQIGVPSSAKILVAGSTHDGEEAVLADTFLELRKQFPDLFLVLVPRHFERTKQVCTDLQKRQLRFILRSEITAETKKQNLDCLLVNTTGELKAFYEVATLVFVGKTLTAHGGQNPVEPAALGKAIITGPNMENFRSIMAAFRANDAIVQVADAPAFTQMCAELLRDTAKCNELGKRALAVVEANSGATARTVDLMTTMLSDLQFTTNPDTLV
ncbi:MAG: Three-deoxy-D-manno-octulosonic-acid transferase domain protein [Verrucomicrobiales bacterium]|nr:Three-deoxy-D-manno-octulosonic-acid transferase domain protein [Verrucomicrobiales bacterium]